MFEEADARFEKVLALAEKNNLPLNIIRKAYEKAKYLHREQKRKGGDPYITHPVEVAYILATLQYDENVISAALLHDTIEDCGYTGEQITKDFNETVFHLVDCVSAIDKEKYIFDTENIFEDPSPDMRASSVEEQTFSKLIRLGKTHPYAFAIKFADRLHNLRTISAFDYPKQLEKVKQTEKWVLPIAKILQSEFFYRSIRNECFKILNGPNGERYFHHYQVYHSANAWNIHELQKQLEEIFSNSSVREWLISDVREYKVFEDLTRLYKKLDIGMVSQGQILKVTNYNIFAIYENKDTENDQSELKKQAIEEIFHILEKKNILKIIDGKIGGFTGKMYFQLEDKYRNKYNLYVVTAKEYRTMTVGADSPQVIERIDESNINTLDMEQMYVRTPTGERVRIAKDSTALDFAFKLHKDIGLSFCYARINGTKSRLPTYTKLHAEDTVEIITEREEDGSLHHCAKLKWLAHVNTENAKKTLIKYIESLLPGQLSFLK